METGFKPFVGISRVFEMFISCWFWVVAAEIDESDGVLSQVKRYILEHLLFWSAAMASILGTIYALIVGGHANLIFPLTILTMILASADYCRKANEATEAARRDLATANKTLEDSQANLSELANSVNSSGALLQERVLSFLNRAVGEELFEQIVSNLELADRLSHLHNVNLFPISVSSFYARNRDLFAIVKLADPAHKNLFVPGDPFWLVQSRDGLRTRAGKLLVHEQGLESARDEIVILHAIEVVNEPDLQLLHRIAGEAQSHVSIQHYQVDPVWSSDGLQGHDWRSASMAVREIIKVTELTRKERVNSHGD